ncbi:MAG TPA: CocE/NonD family hydrolase [Nocardioidaceae bacterium]|nr:CocE/NonD family hydrolase [Nocardioidaceae bacterium]
MGTSISVKADAMSNAARHHDVPSPDVPFKIFAGSTAVGLIHAFDDALVHRQPGVPLTQHLWALLAVVVIAGPVVVLFRRMRTGLQSAVALIFGAVTVTNGSMHALHLAVDDVSGSDVSGILAATAGAVLIVLSAVLPFLHRGERLEPPLRRWPKRVLVTTVTAAFMSLAVLPILVGIGQTHLFRSPIGEPPDSSYEEVTFPSSDGLRLAGWYRPSRNGAAIVVVSGAGGDRRGSVEHARMLAKHGYGVLLYDARGSGESEGSLNGYGWGRDQDVAGALTFLSTRPEVDPERVGGLGLSRGADVLIEVAASDSRLAAVVGDGATARSLADIPPGEKSAVLWMAPVLATASVLSGTWPGPPLEELAAEVSPTPLLLIATGSLDGEMLLNEVYAGAARPPVDLWVLPEAHHTAAIRDQAVAYERRVIGHFDTALLGSENGGGEREVERVRRDGASR